MIQVSSEEQDRRNEVIRQILDDIRQSVTIRLPDFKPSVSRPSDIALLTIGATPNSYSGTIGDFRYQFEGEEDLLHLIITRIDESILTPKEGQEVASFLLEGVPNALIWFKPGERSQHFYFGHDDLVGSVHL